MRRFPWISWLVAGLFILLLFFGLSYIFGMAMYPATFDLYQAGCSAFMATSILYWFLSNRKPRIGGVLRIDTTRDHKDIWRFEVDDFDRFDKDEYVLMHVKRRHIPDSSDEYIEKMGPPGFVRKE